MSLWNYPQTYQMSFGANEEKGFLIHYFWLKRLHKHTLTICSCFPTINRFHEWISLQPAPLLHLAKSGTGFEVKMRVSHVKLAAQSLIDVCCPYILSAYKKRQSSGYDFSLLRVVNHSVRRYVLSSEHSGHGSSDWGYKNWQVIKTRPILITYVGFAIKACKKRKRKHHRA